MPTNNTSIPGRIRSRSGGRTLSIIRDMAQWLVKEEPEHYSYEQLEKDRQTVWAGVKNPLAQKHLRSIRKGDRIFYYHTGKEKRSEEHTSELQSHSDLVCRLLLEKK